MSTKSAITYFLCGGTGINLGLALKEGARTNQNKNAFMVGLDASGANTADGKFPVEYIGAAGGGEDMARGSGKKKMANYEKAVPFVAAVLSKHKPSSYNVVISNSAGGTGSMLATLVFRALAKMGVPTILYVVNDHTSTIEFANSVGTMRSMANQTKKEHLDAPLVFMSSNNTVDFTRGEVNQQVVERLNLLSLFMTETNGEMDYADFANFLQYSKVSDVPPAMSEISFYDQDSAKDYIGKTPVAVASLFSSSNEVIPVFPGTTYRTTGVFAADAARPAKITQLHMCLDHGEAIEKLEQQMQALADHRNAVAVAFTKQKDLGDTGNDCGMIL